jgi:hypothetical protein
MGFKFPTAAVRVLAHLLLLTALARSQPAPPKEFADIITPDARTQAGVFRVHQLGGKLYYEISQSQFGMPFLWLTRVARASNMLGYGNEFVAQRVIDWQLADARVLLRSLSNSSVADPSLPIARAVATTTNPQIIMAFPVQARAADGAVVIDVSNLFASDVPEFSMRTALKAQGFDASRSFIEHVSAFPSNIEVEATYTYTGLAGAQSVEDAVRVTQSTTASMLIHHSMLKLPDQPMRPRLADPRVGSIALDHLDFGWQTTRDPVENFVARWRLEKKNPQAAISDPVQPIEIYVDPATPSKWVPYVKMAIEDWRPALEQAGFRNAIVAREVLAGDKNWNPEDARFTVVNWQAMTSPFAFTSVVTDPRSAEILLAQIHVFQGVINRMAGNYFVQAGPLDPRSHKWPLPDEVIGELIRYVVAHEVGHALGLLHNMAASAMYPAQKLRDSNWVHEMGYTPSIMDYSRFNYVAQPEDGFTAEDLVPHIGPYDRWAIHWDYAPIPSAVSPGDEKPMLDSWAREQDKTPWLRWITENGGEADPANRMESLGDSDPILSGNLGLQNLHRVMDMLIPATANENWRDLEYLYKRVLGQWTNEMLTVTGWVGGEVGQEKGRVDDGIRFSLVPRERQKAAIAFLNQNAFATPHFLIRADVLRRIEPAGEPDHILDAQSWVLRTLISAPRLNRMVEQTAIDGSSAYPPAEFLADLRKGIWAEIYAGTPIDSWRRNLQSSYLEIITARMYSPGSDSTRFLLRAELEELEARINSTLTRSSLDGAERAYLRETKYRIGDILDPKQPVTPPKEPGEPSYFPLR